MRPRTRPARALLRRRRGASYSLPLVLIAPFYLMFVVLVFEIGFLLMTRAGVQYAAFAAARAAAVWARAKPEPAAELRPLQAAWAALAPFATGSRATLAAAGPVPPEARTAAPDHARAVRQYVEAWAGAGAVPAADGLEQKFLMAAARATVTVTPVGADGPHRLIRVTVEYRAPLNLPGVSRFLDPDGRPPYEYPLSATVTLTAEGPETESRTLGIDYSSDPTAKEAAR